MAESSAGLTFLVVPVAAAETVVRAAVRRFNPELAHRADLPPEVVIAHVTVGGPFVPPERVDQSVLERLAEVCRAQPAFDFRLARLEVFASSGVVYLAPEPAAPFVALIRRIESCWPEHPIYGGQHPEPVPHVTLATEQHTPAQVAAVRSRVEPLLPLAAAASEVQLLVVGDRAWRPLGRFPLGPPASTV